MAAVMVSAVEEEAEVAILKNEVNRLRTVSQNAATTREQGTQSDAKPWQVRNATSAGAIRDKIDRFRDVVGYSEIAGLKWPKEVFRQVREVKGNPVLENVELNLLLPIEKGAVEKRILKQVKSRFPEVLEQGEVAQSQGFSCVTYETKVTCETEVISGRRTFFKVEVEIDEEKTYRNLWDCRTKMTELGLNRVAVPRIVNKWHELKKMLEHVFCGSDITIMAYETGKEVTDQGQPQPKPKRKRATDAVLVRAEGSSYADLLKSVREKVDTKKLGIKLRAARQTRNGELLLLTEKTGNAVDNLKEELVRQLGREGVEVVKPGWRDVMTIQIKGMDALTTEEEVVRALGALDERGSGNAEEIKVKMRKVFGEAECHHSSPETNRREGFVPWSHRRRMAILPCHGEDQSEEMSEVLGHRASQG